MTTKTIEQVQEDLDLALGRIDKALEYLDFNSEDCTEVIEQAANILLHWTPNVKWEDEEPLED